jgi:hypothetical protein
MHSYANFSDWCTLILAALSMHAWVHFTGPFLGFRFLCLDAHRDGPFLYFT